MAITKHLYLRKLQENKMKSCMIRNMASCLFLPKNQFKLSKKNFKPFKILKIYYKIKNWHNCNRMKSQTQYIRNIQIDKQFKMKFKKCRLVKYLFKINKKFFQMPREIKYHNNLIQIQFIIIRRLKIQKIHFNLTT